MLALLAAIVVGQPELPLGGPVVRERPRDAIVEQDMRGRVVRPGVPIEKAVVERLELSPEVRERVERVLGRRAAAIDRFVSENLLMLSQFETVQTAGKPAERVALILESVQKLGEAIGGRSLREEIGRELPVEQARVFSAELRRYWRALHEEGRALKPKDPPPPWAVFLGESFASLGREIVASVERQTASGTLVVDYLLSGLDLSEQQQRVVRELKLDLLERTGMRPSEQDQQQLVVGVAAYLNKMQREKVIERIGGKAVRRATR